MSRMGWERIEDLEQQEQEDPGLSGRLYFLRLVFIVILGLLLYRVFYLQQTAGEDLLAQADDNRLAFLQTDASRGVIFDRTGAPLAVNLSSFNVTITPAFLPRADGERQAVFERLSLLTGVPVTNTVQQQNLIDTANPELVSTYGRLAQIYNAPVGETLDQAGIVKRLPDSIAGIVQEQSFAQYLPAVITTGIPITLAYRIEQESIFLPGVRVIPEPLRDYPSGEYTSHIIGFMGPIPNENWINILGYERDDRVGWAGLESSMELELSGSKGVRQIETDWTGREVRQLGLSQEPVAGLNLHLTLDLELQKITTHILEQALQARRETPNRDEITGVQTFPEVEQAAVVAMNPQTGEILAMVSFPTFDNNRFQTEVPVEYYLGLARNDYRPLVNHAISSVYPPGSTFKIVPAAAALQEGVVSASRLLRAPGEVTIPNRFAPDDPGRAQNFVCWILPGEHGVMNIITGLANSCDIYFYKITGGFDQDGEFVDGLTVDRLVPYARQFGFGRVQGIELPLENPGNLPTPAWKIQTQGAPWSTGDDYNLGIGQGFMASTPLQVAQMAAVIANGGFLYRPTIIHHMTDAEGNIVAVDANSQIIARAHPDPDGGTVLLDAEGAPLNDSAFTFEFDENGEYIFKPEVVDSVAIDRQYLETVAEGLQLVNVFIDDEQFYTGATYVDWLDPSGVTTAGKTGTAEYCDNIAISRGWCRFEDIVQRRVLPTHSWYVGYAPAENAEIVVSVFIFNGGEGSAWAAPVACNVIAAYYDLGQFAEPIVDEDGELITPSGRACQSLTFNYEPIDEN